MRAMGRATMVGLALLFGLLAGCSSSDAGSGGCRAASDCTGELDPGCSWACIDGQCESLCTGECTAAGDCEQLSWPLDCQGHWECVDGSCQAVCDQTECSADADCSGQLPCSGAGEWRCVDGSCQAECWPACDTAADCTDALPCEHGGHWECVDGDCIPECAGADCQSVHDCLDLPWEVRCLGHWECRQGQCQEVCDEEGCGDGICDEGQGETADSCPVDCDFSCVTAADCEHLGWPIDCEGHWVCEGGRCQAVCDGGQCADDADCIGRPWAAECLGNWDCREGDCVERCDPEACGDGACDTEAGEAFESCPLDCDLDCVPEGLPRTMQLECCPGLVPEDDCLPGYSCPVGLEFCIDCDDGDCDPHETQFNCPDDCRNGCPAGEDVWYRCPNGSQVPWCVCKEDSCAPVCISEGGGYSGWVDPCTQTPIQMGQCAECQAECLHVGDWEREGWYAVCENSPDEPELLVQRACAPRWECKIDPQRDCP